MTEALEMVLMVRGNLAEVTRALDAYDVTLAPVAVSVAAALGIHAIALGQIQAQSPMPSPGLPPSTALAASA